MTDVSRTIAVTHTFSAVQSFAAGAVGTPSIYLSTDTTSGLYRIGANNIGIAISAAKVIDIAAAGVAITGTFSVSSTLAVTGVSTLTGDIVASNIRRATSDGADNSELILAGGGSSVDTRGAVVRLYGNENAGTGILDLVAGNVVGGVIRFNSGGSVRGSITNAGVFDWTGAATVGGTLVVTGAARGVAGFYVGANTDIGINDATASSFSVRVGGTENRLTVSSAGNTAIAGTLAWGGGAAIASSDSALNRVVVGGWSVENITIASNQIMYRHGESLDQHSVVNRAGSITGLSAQVWGTIGGGETVTIEVMKNGVATAFTLAFTSADGASPAKATTQASGLDTVVAGDRIGIRWTSDSAVGGLDIVSVSVELTS